MRTRLLRTGMIAVALCSSSAAAASSIDLSNPYFRSWNGVIVHGTGAEFSTSLVSSAAVTSGPDAAKATDLGFATVVALSEPLSLHPASSVDARNIASLGYDYVIAEATTWYEADLIITGGSGTVDILLQVFETATSFTDEPGFSLTSLRDIRIFEGPDVIAGITRPAESDLVELEYGVKYRLQAIFSAYSRATAGHQTWNNRDLNVALTIVPEPDSAALVALGLAVLTLCGRRPASRCSGPSTARSI